MVNYNKSCIYKICCRDNNITEIYIGSTTNFNRRKQEHKSRSLNLNQNIYKYIRKNGGWDNFCMIQLKEVCCENKRELERIEREHIEKYNATLNHLIPTRSSKHYKQLYYQDNKETILKKMKLLMKCKCCKCQFTRHLYARHKKTKKHIDNSAKLITNFFKAYFKN